VGKFAFVSEYASLEGCGKEAARERVSELGRDVSALVNAIQERGDQVRTHQQLVEVFRDVWTWHHVSLWKSAVFEPERAILSPMGDAIDTAPLRSFLQKHGMPSDPLAVEAEAKHIWAMLLWAALKLRALAGLELMLHEEMESRKSGFDAEIDEMVETIKAGQPALTTDKLREILSTGGQPLAVLLAEQEEGILRDAREALGALDSGLNQAVANASPRRKAGDRALGDAMLCSLSERTPVTYAVAWRFVLELERCRRWYDGSVDRELRRLSGDRTSDLFPFWEGMTWVASVLWRGCRQQIEHEAKAEGKLERKLAELNTKKYILYLKGPLDEEAGAVAEIRRMQEP
jgi:hypothetical protein